VATRRFPGEPLILVALVVVGVLAATISHTFIPTLGIVVIGAGLFLRPVPTMVAAAAAVLAAVAATLLLDVDEPWVRIGNVVLASCLGVAASVALARRIDTIEALRASETAVLEGCGDAIVVLDPKGSLVRANAAALAMVPRAVPGQPFHDVIGHILPDGTECPGGCELDGAPVDSTTQLLGHRLKPDGVRMPVEASVGPLRAGSSASVVNVRDVTGRVEADEDRRVLLDAAQERELGLKLGTLADGMPLPVIAGLGFDLASRASGSDGANGSDVVDISLMPDGLVLLLMVDATGRGPVSSGDAWKVLFVARALLHAGVPLEHVVDRSAVTLAAQPQPPKASVLAMLLDRTTGVGTVAIGGHPPPMVVRGRGTVEWLAATGGGVGDAEPGSVRLASSVLFPGDRLLLYTDGVVDGARDLLEGLSTLASAAAARRGMPLEGWSTGLLGVVLGDAAVRDDATVLAVDYLAPGGS
jgi:PAS domain-containing protein